MVFTTSFTVHDEFGLAGMNREGAHTFMRLTISMASSRKPASQVAATMASYTAPLAAQPCCCPRASSSAACTRRQSIQAPEQSQTDVRAEAGAVRWNDTCLQTASGSF